MTIEEELAVIALQNEAMREALYKLACLGNGDQFGNSIGNSIAQDALSLPNLAAEVLKRRDAETLRRAADRLRSEFHEHAAADVLRMAAELEKETEYQANEAKAKALGYKYAACLCCGNHDTPSCESCQCGKEPT